MRRFTLLSLILLALILFTSVTVAQESYTVSSRSARVRAEPNTTSEVIATLRRGTAITILEEVEGTRVSGSKIWYRIEVDGETGYIHSSLVRAGTTTSNNTGGSGSSSGGSDSQPTLELISTPVPAAPAGYSCSCSRTCGQMTCDEAYFQLQQCGCSARDGDGDGIPCESVCGG